MLARHPAFAASIVGRNPLGGGGNFGLQAALLGPDLGTLYKYSQQIVEKAKQTPSLVDAKSDYSDASPEVQVAVDRSRAADLGVRMATIGNTLRLMVAGDDEITTYREAGEQYPVTVRVLESQRRDIDMVGKLTVTSISGQPVRIDNIARLERGFGPTRITRSNRQYSINLNADTAPGHALSESSNDLRRIINEVKLPPGYSFQMRGQTQNLDETTDNLILAMALASIFVYMVLAAQFESFVQPLVIMTVLPLSIPFALFTIWATGRTLNLWSALGILLLFGIVKKNSILQVDYTNVLRAQGVPRDQAILDACRTRLRPILMTTLAIIFGLLPTALGVGIGGAQRSAIAVTIIGAQSLCLFLTLLLVPAAYVKLDALEQSLANKRLSAWLSKVRTLGSRSPSEHRKVCRTSSLRWFHPQHGARVFVCQHVQIAVRPLTHVTNALMQFGQDRLSLDWLPLLVERDATDVPGAARSPLDHRADERVALPLRESVSGVEHDAGRRKRRNEVDEWRLEVRT